MIEVLGLILVAGLVVAWGIVEVLLRVHKGDYIENLRREDETYEEWRGRRGWPEIDDAEVEALVEKGVLKVKKSEEE